MNKVQVLTSAIESLGKAAHEVLQAVTGLNACLDEDDQLDVVAQAKGGGVELYGTGTLRGRGRTKGNISLESVCGKYTVNIKVDGRKVEFYVEKSETK